MFSHGIIPDEGTSEDLYQLVSRCLGNIKHYSCYQKPEIYTNKHVHQKILQQEHVAVELAKRYYTDTEEGLHTVTEAELKSIQNEKRVVKPSTKQPKPEERVPLIIPFTESEPHLWSKYQEYLATSQPKRIKEELVINELKSLLQKSTDTKHHSLLSMVEMAETYKYATLPSSDGSYTRKVLNVVEASIENRPYIVDISKDIIEKKNVCAVFVDVKNRRLCICIVCHDATYPKDEEPNEVPKDEAK